MRVAFAGLLLCAAVAFAQTDKPPTALSSAEVKQADEVVKEHFSAKSWEDKQKALEKLAPFDHPSKSDIAAFSKKAFALARQGPRVKGDAREKCTDPDYPGAYLLNVHAGAKQGQPTGVFISLHGGGQGEGDPAQIQALFGTPGKGLINVYPTVFDKTTAAWNEEKEEQYVLAILDDLKRSFNIDTDHVYLWKWMMTKKRDPLPKRVLWEPSRAYKRHFYWLRREAGRGQIDVQREGNRFTVKGSAAGLRILVNERMIKFDQPVVVVDDQGKELFNAKVPLSLAATLDTIGAKKDPAMWFSGWIELAAK